MDGLLNPAIKSRRAVIIIFLVFLIIGVVFFLLAPFIIEDMKAMLKGDLIQTMVAEGLAARLALAGLISAVLTAFFTCLFLLKRKGAVLGSGLLFAAGAAFARTVILPKAVTVLLGLMPDDFILHISVWNYVIFCLIFCFLIGTMFLEPVIVLGLYRIGLLTGRTLRRKRKVVYIVMLILLAFITPTQDALTLIISILPFAGLYEISALWLIFLEKKEGRVNG